MWTNRHSRSLEHGVGAWLAMAVSLWAGSLWATPQEISPTTWLIVRHAERAGQADKLTPVGHRRAQRLAELAQTLGVTAIYSTDFRRTRETVLPAAQLRGIEIQTYPTDSTAWLAQARQQNSGGVILVAGHSNTVGALVAQLTETPPFELDHDQYDGLYLVQERAGRSEWVRLSYDSGKADPEGAPRFFGLRAVDAQTGEGVPLVRFKTTSHATWWSDSQGYVAIDEPGLWNTEVHFEIDSAGYEVAPDGFGFRGIRVQPQAGQVVEVPLQRINQAQRIRRLTGQGIYRDSERLGISRPLGTPDLNAGVTGSDSVQMVPYRGQLFWLWGDTNLVNYPLGNFHVTAATSPLTVDEASADKHAVSFRYFLDPDTDRVRKMCPSAEPGAVWLFGLINLQDSSDDSETLVAHYSRHLRLGEMVERGIVVFDDATEQFRVVTTFDLSNQWQVPAGQAFRHQDGQGDYVYFANPFPVVRVPARLEAICDPRQYQAFSWDESTAKYGWQDDQPPLSQTTEQDFVQQQRLPVTDARFQLRDLGSDSPVQIHRASVRWNDYRQRWIMIGNQYDPSGRPSHLGEVWYAEADEMTGPWTTAIKIATHPGYSFYNPRQHAVWDQADGRVIYFEGTYTQMFSDTQTPVPHYEYNQLLYRLDLQELPDLRP